MRAVLPVHLLDVDQPDVGFVDEGGRLQRVAGALVRHVPARHAAELFMDERYQLLQRGLITTAPVDEQPGDRMRCAGTVNYHTRTRSSGPR